jgi:hypothetical protein
MATALDLRLSTLAIVTAVAACGGGGAGAQRAPTTTAPTPPPPTVAAEQPPLPEERDDDRDDRDDRDAELAVAEPEMPPDEPVTFTFEPDPPTVELLARGKGKRAPLRFRVKAGDPIDCTMLMDMSVQGVQTVVIPTTTMSWTGQVTAVEGDRITTRGVIDVLEVAAPAGADALSQMAGDQTRARLAPLLDATTDASVTDRGRTTRSAITSLHPVDASVAAGMQSGASGGLVLPEQAIGTGARWRVTRVEVQGLVRTVTVATYELRGWSRGVATIDGTIDVAASAAGSAASHGHGELVAHFTGALCIASRATITTEIPGAVPMTMLMALETRARPAPTP